MAPKKRQRTANNLSKPPTFPPPQGGVNIRFADFSRVVNSMWAKRRNARWSKPPYTDFQKHWKSQLGRTSGCGMPGTTNLTGRTHVAYIFYRSMGLSTAHLSFTDVGCDQGEMMAFMLLAGMHSAWGVEIQPGPPAAGEPSARDRRMSGRWQDPEGSRPGSAMVKTPSGIELVFGQTTASLGNASTSVKAAFGVNLGKDPSVHIYPPDWHKKFQPTQERRGIFSFDVG